MIVFITRYEMYYTDSPDVNFENMDVLADYAMELTCNFVFIFFLSVQLFFPLFSLSTH